jgi:hypothetical protein
MITMAAVSQVRGSLKVYWQGDGQLGNSRHLTCRKTGTIPTDLVANLMGACRELPGAHARQRIAFTDNDLTTGAQMRAWIQPSSTFPAGVNNSIVIAGNTDSTPTDWPGRAPVTVENVTDVLVDGNTDPLPTLGALGEPFAHIYSAGKTGSLACGDQTVAGVATDAVCPSPLPVIAAPIAAVLPT